MSSQVENGLAYIDQASFLGLRALGRGPVIQYIWIYERGVDLDGLRRFQRNLQHTLIGRLIERSPLPFGRHRWVSCPAPDNLDVAVVERSRDQVWEWVDERSFLPADPELGPPWHLGVQPLIGGGAAVSLAVSHTTGDAVAGVMSIVDAVNGVRRDYDLPPPRVRSRRQAIVQDIGLSARSAAEIPSAIAAAARLAREEGDDLSRSAKVAPPTARARSSREGRLVVPRVYGAVDAGEWRERASALNGTSNVLFAGFSARLGFRLGRFDHDGRAVLSIPVSERADGDTRANPLNSITVLADPDQVTVDLSGLRGALKQALIELGAAGNTLLAPLALIPFTPKVVVRRLENLILKVGKPVGCTNVGDMPEETNRPDGTDADFFGIRGGEAGVTTAVLERLGGHLLVSAASMRGKVWFSVASWEADRTNTPAALSEVVAASLADFGLVAELEY